MQAAPAAGHAERVALFDITSHTANFELVDIDSCDNPFTVAFGGPVAPSFTEQPESNSSTISHNSPSQLSAARAEFLSDLVHSPQKPALDLEDDFCQSADSFLSTVDEASCLTTNGAKPAIAGTD